MVKPRFSGSYLSSLKELTLVDPELENLINQQVKRFTKNPDDTRLDNHPLTRGMEGKWAFSVTDDIRIVYKWIGKDIVRFLAIGSHQQVYKK